MITLKLIIYSFILFIILVKFSSCQNNIIDLINIILIITLFNLILEKILNTNLKEDYDPISNNNYSSVEINNKKNKNNNYDFEEIDFEKDKKSDKINKNEIEKNEESTDEESKEIKKTNNIEEISNTTNKIVNVIKDNVKNIINNNIINTDNKKEKTQN